MAASTWFHGSAWPPGNHGIMPSGSCHSAMASTVCCSSCGGDDAGHVGEVMRAPADAALRGLRA